MRHLAPGRGRKEWKKGKRRENRRAGGGRQLENFHLAAAAAKEEVQEDEGSCVRLSVRSPQCLA